MSRENDEEGLKLPAGELPGGGRLCTAPHTLAPPYPAAPENRRRSLTEFVGGVEHGDDVLRRHVGQDVVDLLEDESAAGLERVDLLAHVARISSGVPWERTKCVSQPPPQKVRRSPKSAFRPRRSMPVQVICTGLIASRPASIRSASSGRTPPQQWSITLTLASSLARRHIGAWRGLKNSRYMAGDICGPFCMPRSSPKTMMSIDGPTSREESFQVGQVHLDERDRGTRGPGAGLPARSMRKLSMR